MYTSWWGKVADVVWRDLCFFVGAHRLSRALVVVQTFDDGELDTVDVGEGNEAGDGVAVVDGDVGWGPAGLGRNVDEVGMFDAEALAAVCGDGEGAKADWVGQLGEFFSGHRESICSCAQTCAQGRDLMAR